MDVLFKPSTTASVTDAVQSNLSFGKTPTDVQKNGIKSSSDHQHTSCLTVYALHISNVPQRLVSIILAGIKDFVRDCRAAGLDKWEPIDVKG